MRDALSQVPAEANLSIRASWVSWAIAATPLFPPLYALGSAAWRAFFMLPRPVMAIFAFFVVTQLGAALLSPAPLLSLPVAFGRSALIGAMIAVGAYLRQRQALQPLVWGYLLVFLTAFVFTGWTMAQRPDLSVRDILDNRLSHPVYTQVSLGLLAAVCTWLTLLWRGSRAWWRPGLIVLSLIVLILTGSRGPLLALLLGAGVAFVGSSSRLLRTVFIGLVLMLALLALSSLVWQDSPFHRLLSWSLTGRDQVWSEAVTAWLAHPLGGVGPLQGGPYLGSLLESRCMLTTALELAGITCPSALSRLEGAWLIAHNLVLHSLLESGLVGTLGLLALLISYGVMCARSRDPFLQALFWGYMVLNVTDVVSMVPSTHFAELFWVGYGLACIQATTVQHAPAGAGNRV